MVLDIPDNMYRSITANTLQPNQSLASVNEAAMMALSQQGNRNLNYAALMEQAVAQQQMQTLAQTKNLEVPKVNFYPSTHPDARKARKQDIKQAYRLLTPAKRFWLSPARLFGRKYIYNKQTNLCVVDGCDCAELIKTDNLYQRITDDETGRSLWEMYWNNPITGEVEAFLAQDKVTSGRRMKGTYCPEHLHLYHLLCRWESDQEKEDELNPSRFRDRMKKGVSLVTVPVAAIAGSTQPTHKMVDKYQSFFEEILKDSNKSKGINIWHIPNPDTGNNDITMIQFDMRMFQKEILEASQPTPAFSAMLNSANVGVPNQQTQTPAPVPATQEVPQQ
tara:strand:- start:3301 stop:4302 length:1002 start_codon:yes stop_codon:yes gene_type:complete